MFVSDLGKTIIVYIKLKASFLKMQKLSNY